jgi:tetratricopeptide (TPR) repeat protein
MSLITDAMNEAQREANKRRHDSQPALLGDPFPGATRVVAEREWLTNRALVYGAIGFLVFASAVATAIVTYRRLRVEAPRTAATSSVAPARDTTRPGAAISSQRAAGSPAPTSATRAAATPRGPSAVPAPRSANAPEVARRGQDADVGRRGEQGLRPMATTPPNQASAGASTRTPTGAPARSVAAGPPSSAADPITPEPVATTPSTQTPPASGAMRVVVDPRVLRSADSLFARAYAEHTRGNLDGAAELYERALAHPPVSPELYNDYGALLATRGKHAAAVAMYNLGIAANDKDARLWANLGDSYRALGRRADAMSAYFEAARLDPANIPVKVRLAGEYALLGDTANARRGFEQAVRAAPNDAEAHYRFGAFLQTQHDVRGAIRELQAFVDLAPGRYPLDVIDRTKAYIAQLRR